MDQPVQTKQPDTFLVGLAQPAPPHLHVEAIEGGFLVWHEAHGATRRCVAHTVARLAAITREWGVAALTPSAAPEATS